MCLGQGTDLHMAQLMPLPLTVTWCSKSRLVLPSCFYPSGVPERIQEGRKTVVCMRACMRACAICQFPISPKYGVQQRIQKQDIKVVAPLFVTYP